jgi:hypothetical protein
MPPQIKTIKNRPATEAEILNNNIVPEIPTSNKPDIHAYKRGNDTSVRGEEIKNISVGIEDIDSALLYYFDNVIKPYVTNEGTKLNIPVVFADGERWKTAQRDGQFRDKEGRIQFPVITLKLDSMDKDRSLTNKLDGNVANIYSTYEKKYTKKNQYDNFAILTNRTPVREFYNVVVPDYYKISYSCAVYVSFREDLNKIIEAISYRADSYWGQPGKFQFKAKIDTIPFTSQVAEGEDRKFISTFTITLNGYLTPNNIDRFLATEKFKFRGKTQIMFTMEASNQDVEAVQFATQAFAPVAKTSYIPEGISINNTINILDQFTISYLNVNMTKTADSITSNTATFLNSSMLPAPSGSGLPPTSVNDFKFFINGINLDTSLIISFVQVGNNMVLTINTSGLGYTLSDHMQVIAIGKFA